MENSSLFTPPSSPKTSIFLEGLLGSFFFTGFNWNLKKVEVKCTQNYYTNKEQQKAMKTVAPHILLFVYLPDLCQLYLSILEIVSSCYPTKKSSVHQGTWCTHLHKPIVPRRVDLAKLSLLGYVPSGNGYWKCNSWSFQCLEWRYSNSNHSWTVQLRTSDCRTLYCFSSLSL